MDYEYKTVTLSDASPDVLEGLNQVSIVIFNRKPPYDLRDHRDEHTKYTYAQPQGSREVVAMGGIMPVENFAGTGLEARFLCDLGVLPPHRSKHLGRELTDRLVEKVMQEPSKQPRILVADLALTNAHKTSSFLDSALSGQDYVGRVISDRENNPDLEKVLRTKTQLGPDGDRNVLVVNTASKSTTRITHYPIPPVNDFEATRIALRETISVEPESDGAWIVYPGEHAQTFLKILGLDNLPEPRFESDRYARIILPR
jgi:hypothetical protein